MIDAERYVSGVGCPEMVKLEKGDYIYLMASYQQTRQHILDEVIIKKGGIHQARAFGVTFSLGREGSTRDTYIELDVTHLANTDSIVIHYKFSIMRCHHIAHTPVV